jgi:hypothetical protein
LDFAAFEPRGTGFVAVMKLAANLDVRRADAQLPPLPQEPNRDAELFGRLKFVGVAGNVRPLPRPPAPMSSHVVISYCCVPLLAAEEI